VACIAKQVLVAMRICAIKINPRFFLQSIVKQRFTKIVTRDK
jgi:hypothetical protein